MSGPPNYLTEALGYCCDGRKSPEDRPFVTLTFAQSLDAKIAGQHGKQLILSGKESMIMTHWMRTMHDAIMVGIGTALNDDPQLNARHLPPLPDGAQRPLPRPVIVDRHLQLPTTCKLLNNYQCKQGRRPWIICHRGDAAWDDRKVTLEKAGAHIIEVPAENEGNRITASAILRTLREQGINSLMVEGGARIIGSFLQDASMVDAIIVTVAPTFVGAAGVGYAYNLIENAKAPFRHLRTDIVGMDTVTSLVANNRTTKD